MSEISQPHDRFFHKTFSQPERVEDILLHNLPQISSLFEAGTLENTGDSFVDDELKKYYSDVLYKAKLKNDEDAYLYILFEHKSYPEPLIAFDLLRYMVRIWEKDKEQIRNFPLIIPIVFYHGNENWNCPTDFIGLFEHTDEGKEFVPDFRYYLFDLSRYTDEEIKGAILSRAILLLFKYIYAQDFGKKYVNICELLGKLDDEKTALEFLKLALEYIGNATDKITVEQLQEGIQKALPTIGGAVVPTLFEQIRAEGRDEGREEGKTIGLKEGLLEAIHLALEIKFGDEGLILFERMKTITDMEKLNKIKSALRTAENVGQIESLL